MTCAIHIHGMPSHVQQKLLDLLLKHVKILFSERRFKIFAELKSIFDAVNW